MDEIAAALYSARADGPAQELAEHSRQIAAEISAGKNTLFQLVERIGCECLAASDISIKARGVLLLGAVLNRLPQTLLVPSQISAVVQFLCAYLDDVRENKDSDMHPALYSLCSISQMSALTAADVSLICNSIFAIGDLHHQPQRVRFLVYSLLHHILANHRKGIASAFEAHLSGAFSTGGEFISGFAAIVDGEKDPRNLMLAFSILKVILAEFDISKHLTSLFDIVVCYFPITFRPPPDNPYGILNCCLSDIRECIAATPLFAPEAIPMLLDKLNSPTLSAKIDVLETLALCCKIFGPREIVVFITQIWDSVKFEILQPGEEQLVSNALLVIISAIKTLSRGLDNPLPNTPLSRFLKIVFHECHSQITDSKALRAAGRILGSTSQASRPSNISTLQEMLPFVLQSLKETEQVSNQIALLDICYEILFGSALLYPRSLIRVSAQKEDEMMTGDDNIFERNDDIFEMTQKDDILGILAQFLSSSDCHVKTVSLRCLSKLCDISGLLDDSQVSQIIQYFNTIALQDENLDLSQEALLSLANISVYRSQLIIESSFPEFLSRLPLLPTNDEYKRVLSALSQLSKSAPIIECLFIRLTAKVDELVRNGLGNYLTAVFATILAVVQQWYESNPSMRIPLADRLLAQIMTISTQHTSSYILQPQILKIAAQIVNIIIRNDNETLQLKHATPLPENINLQLFASNLVARVADPIPDESTVQFNLILACLFNKYFSDDEINCIIRPEIEKLKTMLDSTEIASRALHLLLNVIFFFSTLTADCKTIAVEDTQDRVRNNRDTAAGFALLSQDHEILNPTNHAVIRILHKQRFFVFCLPRLFDGFKAAQAGIKPNYLIALSNLLANTPQKIYSSDLPEILPLLLESLTLNHSNVKASTIDTLYVTIFKSPALISEHVATIVPQLLKAIQLSEINTMNVRLAALKCLSIIPGSIRYELIHPFKDQVVRGLLGSLDDPLRIVRKEAVDCRHKWINASGLL
ncbi:MMS19 nucleotide excision repair [Neolecta irregularis DAH-3]|uniref:MMS19 nucleotide excision repair protein n=1 Tax=Neolecta irregularis (strain DAH-3) TaxID=1198029 RepID=A0A1U7LUZ1_NEOID|nr:MMS19 nucleotide excision repair [Neolecta irregularis DAH-3]|eukprot:OLL26490.1 MMS19 nucleotide excision repair [Neolecta irregularis DAH-3]